MRGIDNHGLLFEHIAVGDGEDLPRRDEQPCDDRSDHEPQRPERENTAEGREQDQDIVEPCVPAHQPGAQNVVDRADDQAAEGSQGMPFISAPVATRIKQAGSHTRAPPMTGKMDSRIMVTVQKSASGMPTTQNAAPDIVP